MAAMDDREAKIDALSDELEQDLRLLGATAIEDRLQDGVPETIADLKRAGIKIWVATGDRLETAIGMYSFFLICRLPDGMLIIFVVAIGHSTNLIGQESNIIVVRGGNRSGRPVYQQILNAVEEFFPDSDVSDENDEPKDTGRAELAEGLGQQRRSSFQQQHQQPISIPGGPLRRTPTGISDLVGPNNGDRPGGFVLVIDGAALDVALSDKKHRDLLLHLAMLCEGVICCRVSPLQKAMVVRLVKDGLHTMTLAIGDGANDVSMIQVCVFLKFCDASCSYLIFSFLLFFRRLLMSVLVSRVRKACRLSIRQIMLLHRYVDSLLGRDGVGLFIVSACSFDF